MTDPPPPPPPPPPPGGTPTPPPAGTYPGTGFSTWDAPGQVVYQYGSTAPGAITRAPYLRRAAAFMIDSVILFAPIVGAYVFARVGPRGSRSCQLTQSGDIAVPGDQNTVPGLCEGPTAGGLAVIGLLLVGALVLWFVYYAREGSTGQTVGKRLLDLRTVDRRTGEPIGAGSNIGRNLARQAMALGLLVPWFIDHLWPLWDRDGQALHDKIVGAVVVPVEG